MRHARLVAALLVFGCAGGGCYILPKNIARPPSTAILDTGGTTVGRAVAASVAGHPGQSGFLLFNTGDGAIQARTSLAMMAQSSIDAQYFEWAGDAVGRAVLERLIAAADRGVRVRLLVDDYNTKGHDLDFAALDAHPNIEVRVFNPFVRGRLRLPQILGRFTELNHRMHNKMFLVDGQVAVVGGRNLTDDYFGLGEKIDFRDFDLLAIGDVVQKAEGAFDRYWNSEWAYPITTLRKRATPDELARARARFSAHVAADRATFPYRLPHDEAEARAWLEQFRGQATWAPAEVIWDDPSLMARPLHDRPTAVTRRMVALADAAEREIVVENAYVVPRPDAPRLRALVARGVQVRILTNSLATTDEVAVNAAYSKARPAMAADGVGLYEMKPWGASRALYVARPDRSRAHLALHGKVAVFDRAIVFLGSFNLDPRSAFLDTEAVFVVHSPVLARQLLDAFAPDFAAASAWHIGRVAGKKRPAWITEPPAPGAVEVEPHDPASAWRRMMRSIVRLFPVGKYV
ncbi:MAG TPA: phospholipase D family protein [Polyangia bacterium]|nr:phospholipase D family protein [Polyangia bacterium]